MNIITFVRQREKKDVMTHERKVIQRFHKQNIILKKKIKLLTGMKIIIHKTC